MEKKIDRRIKYRAVVDTETCPVDKDLKDVVPSNMWTYDFGFAIVDKNGNVYTKDMGITTTDFMSWLKGNDGKNGNNGADGKDGNNGTNGKDGNDGADGKDGKDGIDGVVDDKLSVIVNYWWDQAMKDPNQKDDLEKNINDIINKDGVDKDEAKNIYF